MRGVSQTEEAGAACSRPQTQRAPVGGLLCILGCHHTQGSLRPASQAPSLTWAVGSPGSFLERNLPPAAGSARLSGGGQCSFCVRKL